MAAREARYASGEITGWLEAAGFDSGPARAAGGRIAQAWNAREFYASATAVALLALLRSAGRPGADVDRLADALARAFGVHLHDVAAWIPGRTGERS